jgi:glycosidase
MHHRKSAPRFLRRAHLAALLLSLALIPAIGQSAKPVITKIDPPNWFTRLPDSLLLIHGEHLENTTFSLQAGAIGAALKEQSISANGHWAFLTFATATAHPGTLQIVATNPRGSTSASYTLSSRRSFAQQPKGFSSADVMYLIMPDRFADGDLANDRVPGFRAPDDRSTGRAYHGGDLKGIEDHLDYLQQLGITTLWTTPLYDNSGNQRGDTYHGYSTTDMYAIDPHFGSMDDYRALVAAAHARGMKVVLDTVPNHVGPATPWANDQPTPDWLHGTPEHHLKVDDDFKSITDPTADPARRRVLLDGWFADILPDLNQDNPLVAQYLLQNAVWWIESAGLDGLRIDTFPYVPRSFWHDYDQQLHALYPHLTDVGEVFNADPHITSFFAGGIAHQGSDGTFDTGLDTPFDFPMYFALRKALTHHQALSALADILKQDTLYPHPERLVTFLGNHDTKRFLSEPGATPAALHLGYGLLATLRGMPELYYGDEIDMTGGDDPDNRRDFPGGFPKDKADAFTAAGRTQAEAAMHDWVATLFELRLHTPELEAGQQQTILADNETLAYLRGANLAQSCTAAPNASRILIVANNDTVPRDISIDTAANALSGCTRYTALLPSASPSPHITASTLQVHLPAQEIAIFRAQP